jgi:hypothetical protein
MTEKQDQNSLHESVSAWFRKKYPDHSQVDLIADISFQTLYYEVIGGKCLRATASTTGRSSTLACGEAGDFGSCMPPPLLYNTGYVYRGSENQFLSSEGFARK